MWSALTCQRFGMRRFVAASFRVTGGRDKVAAFESGNKLPHSTNHKYPCAKSNSAFRIAAPAAPRIVL